MKIINQRFGIGDIIFSMGAIKSLNDKILWPTLREYVDGCNRAYPNVQFIDWELLKIDFSRKDRYNIVDSEVIPLAHQDIPLIHCMQNKYGYFNLDWRQWKKNAMWKRDRKKEFELLKYLNIQDGEKFTLTNVSWGCHGKWGLSPATNKASLDLPLHTLDDNKKNIKFDIVQGFSLFDWATVIERAEYIHSVSTSLLYLFELLNTSAKEIHLYPRLPNEPDFRNVDYLFTKPYILHT